MVLHPIFLVVFALAAQGAVLKDDLLQHLPELKSLGEKNGSGRLVGSGISVFGNPDRLHTKLAQLLDPSANKLEIYYIGGSITQGHYEGLGLEKLEKELVYVGRVEAWFEQNYPGRTLHYNKGVAASTSDHASTCIDSLIGQGADIVFMEYSVNDLASIGNDGECSGLDIPSRRGTERLFRRLLSFDSKPALVFVHTWSPLVLDTWLPGRTHHDFFTTYEDYTDTLLKYYGIPSLSMRNFIHEVVRAEAPGFTAGEMWAIDRLHPSAVGHAILAYCILDHLQLMVEGTGADRLARLKSQPDDILAPPMFPNNHHTKGYCAGQGPLQQQVWSKDEAWEWFNEKDKKGYQANDAVNQSLALKLNLDAGESSDGNYTGTLGLMKSWHDSYGTAAVSCEEGCGCQPIEIDCYTPLIKASLQSITKFSFAAIHPTQPCIIRVKISDKTSSNGHFVRVMTLGAAPASEMALGTEEAG